MEAIQQAQKQSEETGKNVPIIGGNFFIDGKWIMVREVELKPKQN